MSDDFLTAVLGDREGYLALAFGSKPHRDGGGRYRHAEWTETRFRWPAERDRMIREVAHQVASDPVDVYWCPAPRFTDQRRKGDGLPPAVLWVDLDEPAADPGLLEQLNPWLVASGQPGHLHGYVPLTEPVDLGTHARLNRALADRLGGDAKWSDESLLRLPGTYNHKTDPPTLVEVLLLPSTPRMWDPSEVAELLAVDVTSTTTNSTPIIGEHPPNPLPDRVRWALDHNDTTDRSKAHHRLVGACFDADLTRGQALTVVASYKPSVEKYADRLAAELDRSWSDIVDERQRLKTATKYESNEINEVTNKSPLKTATKYESNEINEVTNKSPGPLLHPAALHGLLGAIVRRLEPATEASPAAMLAQLIAYTGALLGDQVTIAAGGSPHPPRVWPQIVGPTAAGRKGESRQQVHRFVTSFISFDSYFVGEASGLSTGEGLLNRLRDDDTATGKTVVVAETEFGRALAASKREGNTLSHVLRDLWDDGRAETMTKGDPIKVTGAHLVVIGHVTPRELRLKLTEIDVSGGLANRFLYVWSRRDRLLPEQVEPPNTTQLEAKFKAVIDWARNLGRQRIRRSVQADAYWRKIYHALAKHEPEGPLGELLARAPAYTLRLALVYALMDRRTEIGVRHLRAGLAVVVYSIASATFVFGDTGGAGDLGRLSQAVKAAGQVGLTRTEISELFSRIKSAKQIDALVAELTDAGQATGLAEQNDKRGRRTERLLWIPHPDDVDPLTQLLDEEDEDEINEEKHADGPEHPAHGHSVVTSAQQNQPDQCAVCSCPLPGAEPGDVCADCYRAGAA